MYNKHDNDRPLVTFLKGMVMGAVEVIPAASGSTMAFVLGIYGRILAVIKALDWHLIEDITRFGFKPTLKKLQPHFVLPLLGGAVAGLGVMIWVVGLPQLVRDHPQPVYGFFFGLMVATIALLFTSIAKPWRMRDGLYVMAGAACGWLFMSLVPAATPDGEWFYVICGALAVLGLLLPGISGSFVLVILGKYEAILSALAALDLDVLMPLGLGVGIGLAAFARIIGWLLEHHHRGVMLTICGTLLATLAVVWPFQERMQGAGASVWLTCALMMMGCGALFAMQWWAGRVKVRDA